MPSRRLSIPLLVVLITLTLLTTPFARGTNTRLEYQGAQPQPIDRDVLPESENELVTASRKAIIETGISDSYFARHFQLDHVFNRPGDQRALWKFRVNGYEATVNDAIGFYKDEHGRRAYTHSIKTVLGRTHDITRTISKTRSTALMRACLGRFTTEGVALMRLVPGETASLFLIAYSREQPHGRERQAQQESARETIELQKTQNAKADQPESEVNGKHRPAQIGYINLETGKCSKGLALVTP